MTTTPHARLDVRNCQIAAKGTLSRPRSKPKGSTLRSSLPVSQTRTAGGSQSELASNIVDLKKAVHDLLMKIKSASDVPKVFKGLQETLGALEITLDMVLNLVLREGEDMNRTLLFDINAMRSLLKVFSEKTVNRRFKLASVSDNDKKRSGVFYIIWDSLWCQFIGRKQVRAFHQDLNQLFWSILRSSFPRSATNPHSITSIREPHVEIEDFFGAKWYLPQVLCLDPTTFKVVLQARFKGGPAALVIDTDRYHVFARGRFEIVRRSTWTAIMEIEAQIQLSVIIQRPPERDYSNSSVVQCPRCKAAQRTSDATNEWVDCRQCESRFSLFESDSDDHVLALDSTRRVHTNVQKSQSDQGSPFKYYSIAKIQEVVTGNFGMNRHGIFYHDMEWDAVYSAASAGDVEALRHVLENGANINVIHSEPLTTPLGFAAQVGDVNTVKILLQHGADVEFIDSFGETPICEAARLGRMEAVKVLVAHGAYIDQKDRFGNTPLAQAFQTRRLADFKFFLENGATIDPKDSSGRTPLLWLLDLMSRNPKGARKDDIKLLVELGADIHVRDNYGETPLSYAKKGVHTDIAQYLVDCGAKY